MTLRAVMGNREVWGWGFFFTTFWLLMGAFVFSAQLPQGVPFEAYLSYTAVWCSMAVVLSMSSIAIGMFNHLYHASFALRYVTKFTSITPTRYYMSTMLSNLIQAMVFAAGLLAELIAIFSYRFGADILPRKPLELIISTMLSTFFFYVLALFLVLTVLVLRAGRLSNFISFVPLMVSYPLLLSQLNINLGILVYLTPYTAMNSLLYHYYSGTQIPAGPLIPGQATASSLNPLYLWISLFAWIAFLSLISLFLVGKQKGISIEELRQI